MLCHHVAMPSRDNFCPVAKAVETVGDRWSLLVVREMLRGVRHFNELERSIPGISRSILSMRLKELEHEGLAVRRSGSSRVATEYVLTDTGRDLGQVLAALSGWAERWFIPRAEASELDPDGLMQWIWRHVDLNALPPHRVVIAFNLLSSPPRRFWLVLKPGDVALCPDHPGFEEDLEVTAAPRALYRLVLGHLSLEEALDAGSVQVEGATPMVRALPGWLWIRRRSGPSADDWVRRLSPMRVVGQATS
jgi:DNA-binding HxlR family transcriptional regulator